MTEKNLKQISRSKDGIPIWDGDSGTFQEYEECALLWEQSIAYEKRYLCGPKLINELVGTARRFVVGKRPEWVSYNGGVQQLLRHLREHLGLPQMPEVADFLNRYFKQSRRRRGETINDYITRKTEAYARARQSLSRVIKTGASPIQSQTRGMTVGGCPQDPWQQSQNDPWASGRTTPGALPQASSNEVPQAAGAASAGPEAEDEDDWASPRAQDDSEWQHSQGWDWNSSWSSWWSHRAWRPPQEDEQWKFEAPELLPDFVQGWFLLHDTGLDTGEKNMIMAAIKGDYTFTKVAQELRNQWTDDDLRKRDQQHRTLSLMAEADTDVEDAAADEAMMGEDLSEEGQALWLDARKEIQEAYALIEQGRRTLRQARNRQHQVKMSRRYYKTSYRSATSNGLPSSTSQASACLRCGGDHKTANCPKQDRQQDAKTATEVHAAPFVCFTETTSDPEMAMASGTMISTREAVAQGKAVIDGGATKTLGSVAALEQVMALNQAKHGIHGLHQVDPSERPVFGFGNSSRDQCLSTAQMKIMADQRPGSLKIHTLDKGDGPILFSIESLRSLGAIVDFSEDLIVFRKLNDRKLIPLERSSTGHQLLPMTSDWYEHAHQSNVPIPSLKDYI